MKPPPESMREMDGATALVDAARIALGERLRAVRAMAPRESEGGDLDERRVHQLRVSTRRAGSTLRAFEACLPRGVQKELAKELKRVRRAAGPARRADVHAGLIGAMRKGADRAHGPALAWLAVQLERERALAREGLAKLARGGVRRRVRALRRETLDALREPEWVEGRKATLRDGATRGLTSAIDGVRDAAEHGAESIERLHELRIAVKRLRYAMEVFAPALRGPTLDAAYATVEEAQERLGSINDAHEIAERAAAGAAALREDGDETLRASMESLTRRCVEAQDVRVREFAAWWPEAAMSTTLDALERAVVARDGDANAGTGAPAATTHSGVERVNGATHTTTNGAAAKPSAGAADIPGAGAGAGARRLAAIDIGTNTIRLIIAEAESDGSYRVLDDEKEIARLGQGLNGSGAMEPEQMERASTTIASMVRIAEGYGAHEMRAVGTAVLRAASNRDEFLAMVLERCGLEIDVVSADDEARLTFESASNAFDVESLPTAVVDIGGGSTEVVLTAGGVIERIYTIELGAVRVTEQFGGAEAVAGARYDEMRAWVDERFASEIGEPPFRAQMLIGAGGTFEALAKMDILRREPDAAAGAPIVVRGYDLGREDVRSLRDWLRAMTPAELRRVPGLSPQRADIIVAGVTLVERLMRALGVRRLRVHDGGIRDGLLLRMVRAHTPRSARPSGDGRDPMRSVRQFAATCNFDRRHCDHVASLALNLFDQLSARVPDQARKRFDDESRLLLHGAAELHDVGYHINYEKHHRHSYHLIMHSGMSGFTPRQIDVIACVARYHRGSKPKGSHAEFARLSESDKFLVRWLSAVLRVADGLDRTHMQNITDLRVRIESDRVLIVLTADKDPAVDVWGAERKSGLFEDVFGLPPAFAWASAPQDAATGEGHSPRINALEGRQ